MPESHAPELNKQQARQGETSGHMRIVLAVSLIGAIVVLAAVLVWWSKVGQSHLPAAVAAPTEIGLVRTSP
jgi:hypothetical protein